MNCELSAQWGNMNNKWETHRHWFLYEDVAPSCDFKVYNYGYEEMDTSK